MQTLILHLNKFNIKKKSLNIKNNVFLWVFSFLTLFNFNQIASAQTTYIKIGEAQAKKSNFAFPKMNQITQPTTSYNVDLAADIHSTITKNLELSTYFTMMSDSAFPSDTNKTNIKSSLIDAQGFKFDYWKQINADFLVRSSFNLKDKDIVIEMYLYQVSEMKAILAKKYTTPKAQYIKLAHTISNDILETITGKPGIFLSKIIATTDRTGHKEVVTMEWDGSNSEIQTSNKNITLSPNWSPDGKKILYSVYTKRIGSTQTNLTLFQQELLSKKRVIISNRQGLNSGASYSPDGKFIYLSMSFNGSPDIYKLDLKGNIVARLTNGPAGALNVEPSISQDGDSIAYSSDRGGNPAIYTLPSTGGVPKRLTLQGKFNSSPSWSPDKKIITFASQESGNFDVFTINSDGTNLKRITSAVKPNGKRASNEDPQISPDGRFIVFTSNRTGKFQIYVTNIDGTEERRVTNDSYNYYKPKWSHNIE